MDEVHVVGPTADRRYLIVARDDDGSRFSLPVDSELVRYVEDMTGESLDGHAAAEAEQPAAENAPDPSAGLAALGVVSAEPADSADSGPEPARAAPAKAEPQSATDEPPPQLPPREIQARLRAGHTVRSVAKAAGTSTERVQPWLRAVEGEREQVLAAWRTARLRRSRLGPSHDLLGDAVRFNLRAKGVDPDAASWKVRRTDGQSFWTVELRYTSRGRTQRALYRYYPERAEVEPRNELAANIGWTRGSATSEAPAPSQPFTAAARQEAKAAGTKAATKKAAGKKAAGKKAAGKKAAGKKAAGKKAAGKKAAGKKTAAKKTAAPKTTAKKASGRQTPRSR